MLSDKKESYPICRKVSF